MLAAIGFLSIFKVLAGLFHVVLQNHVISGTNLKKYGAGTGAYAVITGSTDGIGKEFALNFAKHKFNLVLISRTHSKLEAVKAEIIAKYPECQVKIYALDFSSANADNFQHLKGFLSDINVSVLVNNVGTNHSIPTAFVEESDEILQNIVNVNITGTLRMTKCVLNDMVKRKNGLVINVGSFSGMVPIPFLQTYSGSKAFLRFWSMSLAAEVKPFGVHVEHLNTYFVATNMSKIKRASLMIPNASTYVKTAIKRIGLKTNITPYPLHNLISWFLQTFVPEDLMISRSFDMQMDIRKRALRKLEREKKA
eukprot:Partr_v1_DN24560_c0_g1_i3_m19906 putative Component of the microsomal membrane bound fatty acid elongation system, which produces the 26-carbon very long-chain fatty acids (VLCFA) from palmitate. Catalyzes the reduction of the 3-ketoacyl-CoA intermediate that is formed in each cycle of fatty acid elongation. VLCFAs serve as precursors for ceramide and sphingolipids (By similarity)